MHLSDQQIKEIAQNLGMDFMSNYIHKTKAEFVCLMYPNEDLDSLEDIIGKDAAEEVLKEAKQIEDNRDDYVLIERMDSTESYRIMEDFIDLLRLSKAKTELGNALQKRGPFRQFKDTLYDFPDVQKEWYRYRDYRNEEYVKESFHLSVDGSYEVDDTKFKLQLYKNATEVVSTKINYHNKQFRVLSTSSNGAVSDETIFTYQQIGNIVTSTYEGEDIVAGHLMGLVDVEGNIDMRYHQINKAGELMTGKCRTQPEILKNGKLKLHESWEWTSGDFSKGKSTLEEI